MDVDVVRPVFLLFDVDSIDPAIDEFLPRDLPSFVHVSILHSARDLERARTAERALPVMVGRFAPVVAGLPHPAFLALFARGRYRSLAQSSERALYRLLSGLQVIDVLYRQRQQRRVVHRLDPTEVLVDVPAHRPVHTRRAEPRIARYWRVVVVAPTSAGHHRTLQLDGLSHAARETFGVRHLAREDQLGHDLLPP